MVRRTAGRLVFWAAILFITSNVVLPAPLVIDRELVLEVRNYTRINPTTFLRAMDFVVRLFRQIGVSVTWFENGNSSTRLPRLHLILLEREIPELREPGRMSLGAAPRTRETPGCIAYVFDRPIDDTSRAYTVDKALVLAYAITHELAHLLLPAGHSTDGLMSAVWGRREMREAVWGILNFSVDESHLIREGLPVLRKGPPRMASAAAGR